ncbi:MAG: HAD family hydrolase [Gemmatimonadota bacterium]
MNRPAVFFDRDGTLIDDPGYLNDPEGVRLKPDAIESVRRVAAAGFLAIVVTNQSGIARGLLTIETYHAIERRVDALLAQGGARLDAHYFCPHLPDISGPCPCRKPGTQLFQQAAEQFGIDFTRSWWIGDKMRDVEPAVVLGGRGILLASRVRLDDDVPDRDLIVVTHDLRDAIDLVVKHHGPSRTGESE